MLYWRSLPFYRIVQLTNETDINECNGYICIFPEVSSHADLLNSLNCDLHS